MFSDIGQKIQSYSKLICAIEILLSIIAGVALGAALNSTLRSTDGPFISSMVGFFVIVAGIFLAWISQMRLYAYGKIAECCEVMMFTMTRMESGQPVQPPVRRCSCGAVLDDDALFCPECGKKVGD